MSEEPCSENESKMKRPLKNLTQLSLKWLADKMRKAEEIRAKVQSGAYRVDSSKIASSLAGKPESEDKK